MTPVPIRIKNEEIAKLMVIQNLRSRTAFAQRAEILPQHLSKVLNGQVEPTLRTISRFCMALDCQPGDILEYLPD